MEHDWNYFGGKGSEGVVIRLERVENVSVISYFMVKRCA
jgi:hypothetical protein